MSEPAAPGAQGTPEGNDDRWAVRSTNTTWGPNPGDRLAPPPTPQAPEIPMSSAWPWVAGAAVVLRYVILPLIVLGVVLGVIGLIVHWW